MELGQEEEKIMAPSLTKVNKTWIFITLQILATQKGEASSKEAFKTIPNPTIALTRISPSCSPWFPPHPHLVWLLYYLRTWVQSNPFTNL